MAVFIIIFLAIVCIGALALLVFINKDTLWRSTADKDKASQQAGVVVHFNGQVKAIDMLGPAEVTLIPTHFDMRYYVTIKINQADKDNDFFKPGKVVHFGIHSPAMLFWGIDQAKLIEANLDFVLTASFSPETNIPNIYFELSQDSLVNKKFMQTTATGSP